MSIAVLLSISQTAIISMLVFYLQRKQNMRDEESRKKIEDRKKEDLLLLEMNVACADLAYCVAVAIKNNRVNGEVDESIETYRKAKSNYFAFLNKQAKERLAE